MLISSVQTGNARKVGESGMPDREKVIKGIRKCLSHKPCSENGCPYEDECAVEHLNDPLLRDALELLKEQEEREKRICKSICEFIRGACSTDTDDDKDFVCYEIQKCFTSEGR